jgi:hypothetical protein
LAGSRGVLGYNFSFPNILYCATKVFKAVLPLGMKADLIEACDYCCLKNLRHLPEDFVIPITPLARLPSFCP